MIIEVEDRFCRVAEAFSKVLDELQRAGERPTCSPLAPTPRSPSQRPPPTGIRQA